MNKQDLRQECRRITRALPAHYCCTASAAICDRLFKTTVWEKAKTVFVYLSLPTEPDTHLLIEKAWLAGKKVCVPHCIAPGHMEAVAFTPESRLVAGLLHIPYPENEPEVQPFDIDLAIVPCMAATLSGKRLGHGAGFYDRYLASINAPKVCLCFDRLIKQDLPTEPHDKRMDAIVTENSVSWLTGNGRF